MFSSLEDIWEDGKSTREPSKYDVFRRQIVKTLESPKTKTPRIHPDSVPTEVIAKLANRSKKPKLAFQMVEELRRGTRELFALGIASRNVFT